MRSRPAADGRFGSPEGSGPRSPEPWSIFRLPPPVPSPDGRRVVIPGRHALDLLTLATGERTRLASGDPSTASWSPDGRWIAFLGLSPGVSVIGVDRKHARRLTFGSGDHDAVWSPDGKQTRVRAGSRWHSAHRVRRRRPATALAARGALSPLVARRSAPLVLDRPGTTSRPLDARDGVGRDRPRRQEHSARDSLRERRICLGAGREARCLDADEFVAVRHVRAKPDTGPGVGHQGFVKRNVC